MSPTTSPATSSLQAETALVLLVRGVTLLGEDAVVGKIRDRQRVATEDTERITARLAALQ